jgi:hypothetical protein
LDKEALILRQGAVIAVNVVVVNEEKERTGVALANPDHGLVGHPGVGCTSILAIVNEQVILRIKGGPPSVGLTSFVRSSAASGARIGTADGKEKAGEGGRARPEGWDGGLPHARTLAPSRSVRKPAGQGLAKEIHRKSPRDG